MKLSSIKLALTGLVALGTVMVAAPAQAEGEPPLEEQYVVSSVSAPQNPSENLVLALTVGISDSQGNKPAPGTELRVDAYSCGRLLQSATAVLSEDQTGVAVWFSPDGEPSASKNSVNSKVGPSVEYVATIVQEGYNAYTREGSYSGYEVRRPSCDQLTGEPDPEPTGCVVRKWSKKKPLAATGTGAFAGSKVAVTRTRSNCSVQYHWILAGKVVKQSRSYFIPVRAKGRYLSVRVTVTRSGEEPKMRTIRYGRVQ